MGEKDRASKVAAPLRPTIALPPRPSVEAIFAGAPGSSPSPMTLVSSFFSDHYPDSDCRSFSQLLAFAMASPLASKQSSLFVDHSTDVSSSKEVNCGDGDAKNSGYKQNRPLNLVVAHSPVFIIPPGLSPSGLLNSPGFFSPKSPFGMSHQQALAHVMAQAALSQSSEHIKATVESFMQCPSFASYPIQQQMHMIESEPEGLKTESSEVSRSDWKPPLSSLSVAKPANDGYSWRKYGQKQVKASEYPRSYYKCTHFNCPVRKKVERCLDGQITEIIYKGQHNHKQPELIKRSKDSDGLYITLKSQAKPELGCQSRTKICSSNKSVPSHSVTGKDQVCTQVTSKLLAESIDHEEMEDVEIKQVEEDVDVPNPKKRKADVGASKITLSRQTVTEPRFIVQTRSELDFLDDGYKWRKYGQKVVKGSSQPRSYYKCTHMGCNVRKHVERASKDPKTVVTTYEGKHNHDAPAARKSSHVRVGRGGLQLEPKKVAATKPALDFANEEQRPAFLHLQEEQIKA